MLYSIAYQKFEEKNVIPLFNKEGNFSKKAIKLKFICKAHENKGVQEKFYKDIDFDKQYICKYCNIENSASIRSHDYEFIKNEFIVRGLTLLSAEYINRTDWLEFICNKHPEADIQKTTYDRLSKYKDVCRECRKINHSGEGNPMWKGGTSSIRDTYKNMEEYKNWQYRICNKYNGICQCCLRKTRNPRAHHLYMFSKYEQFRMSNWNGILLCSNCHDSRIKNSFHNLYGTQNTYPEDLYEYIQRYQSGEFNKIE